MKQNITLEQYQELTFEQQGKLFHSLFPLLVDEADLLGRRWTAYSINPEYLTIGRMIEFLDEHNAIHEITAPDYKYFSNNPLDKEGLENRHNQGYWDEIGIGNPDAWHVYMNRVGFYEHETLCDALWAAVKEVLEKWKGK